MLVPSTTLSTWHRRRERKWRVLLYILFLFGLAILAKADAVVPWIDLVYPRSAVLSCRDSIVLRWSRPLSALPPHSRGLVHASAGAVRIAQDDSTIIIDPPQGGWSEDVAVVEAEVSALTGVSSDDRRWSLPLRRGMLARCVARCEGHVLPPEDVARCVASLTTTVTAGGAVPIAAPGTIGSRWRFREWRYRDSGIVRKRNDHIVVIEAPCWEIRDTVTIEAVYEQDSIEDTNDGNDVIELQEDASDDADRFRLRIEIRNVDKDVRFNAVQGVELLPGDVFDDIHERTQSVCVRATTCWEIIGVVDNNGRTIFTQPQREYCGAWTLTKPTTIVRILVQRRTIRLNIDRLCRSNATAEGYDPHCRPHKDGTIAVCAETKAHGFTLWLPIYGVECSGSNVERKEWLVRCGDRLRIAVREQPMRDLYWYGWLTSDLYPRPEYVGFEDGAHWYEVLVQLAHARMGQPSCRGEAGDHPVITLRALFDQGLVVESLGLRVRIESSEAVSLAGFEERTFDALRLSALATDEPPDGRQLEYLPGKGTLVVVRFSRPVDLTTINAGGLAAASYDNVHPRFPDRSTSFETRSQFDERLVIRYDGPNIPPQEFEFYITDPTTSPRRHALYMGEILLEAATSLRATDGTPMARRQQFVLSRMEYPGAALRLQHLSLGGIESQGPYVGMVQGFSATARSYRNQLYGFRLLPDCEVDEGCVFDVDVGSNVDVHGAFAVFEPNGLYRTEELQAVLWGLECSSHADVPFVRDAVREVLVRSADVLAAQYAGGRRTAPIAARQAVYHAARVDVETTHASGIEALHWSLVDVTAERLRRPFQAVSGGDIWWTYDVRLYPRKAVLE